MTTSRSKQRLTDFVTIKRYAEASGYTEKAVVRKIQDGIWLEGKQWVRAPDGRILVNVSKVEHWVETAYHTTRRRASPRHSSRRGG